MPEPTLESLSQTWAGALEDGSPTDERLGRETLVGAEGGSDDGRGPSTELPLSLLRVRLPLG